MERILITGGRIVDGAGNPWFYADLLIEGSEIAAIAPASSVEPLAVHEVVDATGHVVCPGFIDIQSHSIVPFLSDRRSLSKITQGVTTEIMGEDWTPSPFGGHIQDPLRESWPSIPGDHVAWRDLVRSWTRNWALVDCDSGPSCHERLHRTTPHAVRQSHFMKRGSR